jgi:hypothetical protein
LVTTEEIEAVAIFVALGPAERERQDEGAVAAPTVVA